MDYFMPSDIARLVLGYLKENAYQKTFQCFLKECSHLREFYDLVKAGRHPRQISPLNLIIILNEWGKFKYQNDQTDENEENTRAVSPSSSYSYGMTDETVVSDNDVTQKNGKKRTPKKNKKIFVVTKKIKSPTLKSPRTPKSNISLLSPRKLRSGKSVMNKLHRPDASFVDQKNHDSPDRSSLKSPARTLDTPEKSPAAKLSVGKDNTPVSRQLPSDGRFSKSPCKHVQFYGTNKNDEIKNHGVTQNKEEIYKSSAQEAESVHASEVSRISESLDRSGHDLKNSDKKNSSKHVILLETLSKNEVEPPSESVGITDKCISWMNSNVREQTPNTEHTTDGSNGGSSECSSSESNVKSSGNCDKDDKRSGQEFRQINHDPVIPILKTPKKATSSIPKTASSLVTPIKLLQASDEHTSRSPRRKKPKTPRKREVSPVSAISVKSVDPMFEKILSDHRLHEKLAETCNSIVHNQIKLSNCSKEKKETSGNEQVSPTPTHISIDQETIAASKSLEEILEIDNYFHTELLSDNFDMSDPAYESLFKLFGTDRETFNGYLRREKEKELAQMEAEVEELERSNHEILCANFGMPHDTSYETNSVNSPHHAVISQQDLFSSQTSKSGQITSTPCIDSVPVNFTPLLRSHELGSSPVHSSGMFCGTSVVSDKRASPGSTATQPFSPAYSHGSNPPTPRNHQPLSMFVNDSHTPRQSSEAPHSNPATPQPSSPNVSHLVHSTPTRSGSVRSQNNLFHHSSPIQHLQNNSISNKRLPPHCSPLVKGDLHPGSPKMVQRNTDTSRGNQESNIIFPTKTGVDNGLYFNSQQKLSIPNVHTNSDDHPPPEMTTPSFLNLLNDDLQTPNEPCSTVANSIECVSLPLSSGSQHVVGSDSNKSKVNSGETKEKDKNKQKGANFSTLKGLLSKPLTHPNSVPLGFTVAQLHEALKNSEKKGDQSITFHSPNGKTSFQIPILDCQNDPNGLDVLGMNGPESDADRTINVYNESLDLSAQYSIAPENQATQDLVNAIKAGNSSDVLQKMQPKKSSKSRKKSKKQLEKKDKQKENDSEKSNDSEISGSTPTVPSNELDPTQDMYTATPLTAFKKATTVRALNFGPNAENLTGGGYRTIFPKMPVSSTPSVLIFNTNQLINPACNVMVNSKPGSKSSGKIQMLPSDICSKDKSNRKNATKMKTKSKSHEKENNEDCSTIGTCKTVVNIKSTGKLSKELETIKNPPVSVKSRDNKKKKNSFIDEHDQEKVVDENDASVKSEECEELDSSKLGNEDEQPENDDGNPTSNKKILNRSREKLKVKLPIRKSPRCKKHKNDDNKGCIPFYFKPKNTGKDSKKTMQKRNRTRTKKVHKSVEIIIESESSSNEDTVGKTPVKNENDKVGNKDEIHNDSPTPSKEVLLEKIGLTPKKNVNEMEKILRSPNRANALDILAEWQSSPLSSRKRSSTPNRRSRFSKEETENFQVKSPSTPSRKTPAKKLFTSPCKDPSSVRTRSDTKSRSTTKRVNAIIDRLKQNNPGTTLPSPLQTNCDKKNNVKVSKRVKEKESAKHKEQFIENKDETETTDVSGENDFKITSDLSKQDESDKMHVNYEQNFYEVENSASPMSKCDAVSDHDFVNEIENVNSQDAHELDQAVASIASENTELDFQNSFSHEECTGNELFTLEGNELVDNEHSSVCSDENEDNYQHSNQFTKTKSNDADNFQFIVTAEVHSYQAMIDSDVEKDKNENNSVISAKLKSAFNESDNDIFKIHAASQVIDKVKESNSTEECDELTVENKEVSERINVNIISTRKEKRRKHKHRHHRHRHNGGNNSEENVPVSNLIVSPENEREHRHRHHHHKKKKRSHKRHREGDEERHNSKRRKKDKNSVSLDSLAALDVEEALSQIYRSDKSV